MAATLNAPTSLTELRALLVYDIKVKVAGEEPQYSTVLMPMPYLMLLGSGIDGKASPHRSIHRQRNFQSMECSGENLWSEPCLDIYL